jgi:hypothetical protein
MGIAMTPDPNAAAFAAARVAFEAQHAPHEVRDYLVLEHSGATFVKVEHPELGTFFAGGPTDTDAFARVTWQIRERKAGTA